MKDQENLEILRKIYKHPNSSQRELISYLNIVNFYGILLSSSILKLRKNFLKVKKIFLKNNILYFFLGLLIIIFLRLSAKFYFLRRIGHYIGEGNDLFFNAILSLTYITFSYLIFSFI